MGEYAERLADRERIKLGTCEDLFYLRASQRHHVRALPGNVDVSGPDALACRFRFPWPDEDQCAPGNFDGAFDRSVCVPGVLAPSSVDHHTVQFVASVGYVVSLPCPEGLHGQRLTPHGPTIGRNGFAGAVHLCQHRLLADGRLVPVLRCGGCGARWRLEAVDEIEALAVAFHVEGDHRERLGRHHGTGAADRQWWDDIAARILQGARLDRPGTRAHAEVLA